MMLKTIRIDWIKFLLDLIDHKCFNTKFVRGYKKLFSHVASENMVIFDVGSHEGEFIQLFRRLFPNCQIHCFEPDAKNFGTLYQKFGNTSGVHLNNFGIGDVNSKQTFYRNILSYTSSFKEIDLDAEWTKTKSRVLGIKPQELIVSQSEVPIKTLDDYAREHSIEKIHILKIDTEGYELKCLGGCKRLLKGNLIHSIQLEAHFDDMYKDHYSSQEIEALLLPYGYRLYKKTAHYFLKCHELIYTQSALASRSRINQ